MSSLPLSEESMYLFTLARYQVQRLKHTAVAPEHLLLAISQHADDEVDNIFGHFRVNRRFAYDGVLFALALWESEVTSASDCTPLTKEVVDYARVEAERFESTAIYPPHLLYGLVRLKWSVAGRVLAALVFRDEHELHLFLECLPRS